MQNPNENNLPIIQQNNLQVVDNQLIITDLLLGESEEIAIKNKYNLKLKEQIELIEIGYEFGKATFDLGFITFKEWAEETTKELGSNLSQQIADIRGEINLNLFLVELWKNKLPRSLDTKRRSLAELAAEKSNEAEINNKLFTSEETQKIAIIVQSAAEIGYYYVQDGITELLEWKKVMSDYLKEYEDSIAKLQKNGSFEEFLDEIWNSKLPSSVDAERRKLSEIAAIQLQKKSKIKLIAREEAEFLNKFYDLGKATIDLGITKIEDFIAKIKSDLSKDETNILGNIVSKYDRTIDTYLVELWTKKLPRDIDSQRRSLAELAAEKIAKNQP